jgi:hypothetical protein
MNPRLTPALTRLFAAGIAGACAPLAAADPPPQHFGAAANLFTDGDCEHVDHGPQDWTGFGPGSAIINDPDQATGHVLRLQADEGAAPPVPVHATVVAHAMARLLVSARLRTANLRATTDQSVVDISITGKGVNGEVTLATLGLSRGQDVDWTPLSALVPVPPGIIVLWIDDVVLNPDPAVPAQVIGLQVPPWAFNDAATVAIQSDPAMSGSWLRLSGDRPVTAVTWATMAADWKRIALTLRLRGDGLVLGAAARAAANATASATAAAVRAGVLVTWVDDHDRPLGATFTDLMMPVDGNWTPMKLHLDIPRPGAVLRLQAVLDGGGTLDIDSLEVLPILAGD